MKRKILLFTGLSLALLFSLKIPLPSKALTVGPAKMQYNANPGDTISGSLFVLNDDNQTQTLYPAFEKFTEKNGEKQFLPGAPVDLADWFNIQPSVTLPPKGQKDLPFTIQVPKDASPGGYYAVIWWSATPPPAGPGKNQQVSIVTRAGILVFLRVAGAVVESGEISSFDTSNPNRIFFSFPITFAVSFKNRGTVHLMPGGTIEIKSILGQTVKTLAVNRYGAIILPDSEKGLDVAPWESGYAFGPYKATLNLVYGDSNNSVSKTMLIFIFEWHVLLVIIGGLFVVLYLIPKGIKKYNQWIVAKYAKP